MQYDDLLTAVRSGLDEGRIAPAQLERLLRRSELRSEQRPDAAGILVAAGLAVAFAGVAMLYAAGYGGYGATVRETTPYLFPLVAIAAAVVLARAGRPRWQVEAAGLVGYTAYALAALAAGTSGDGGSGYVAVAALAGALVALVAHRWLRSLRLTAWGVSAGSAVFIAVEAVRLSPVAPGHLQWAFLPEAAVVAVAAALLLPRDYAAAAAAAHTAAVLAIFAASFGANNVGWGQFSARDVVLLCVVTLTLVAAAAFDLGGLLTIGNLGGVIWLIAVPDIEPGGRRSRIRWVSRPRTPIPAPASTTAADQLELPWTGCASGRWRNDGVAGVRMDPGRDCGRGAAGVHDRPAGTAGAAPGGSRVRARRRRRFRRVAVAGHPIDARLGRNTGNGRCRHAGIPPDPRVRMVDCRTSRAPRYRPRIRRSPSPSWGRRA